MPFSKSTPTLLLILFLPIVLLSGCWTPPVDCSEFEVGLRNCAIEHDDWKRAYELYIPESYDGEVAVPLVLDFHGTASPTSVQRVGSGLKENADEHGFIAVWPAGTSSYLPAFNGAICCDMLQEDVDDVDFARTIVEQVSAIANIDQTKIFATGVSNGGAMTQRLGCEASDLFSAIAPVSFALPDEGNYDCEPGKPVPVFLFHSLHDTMMPYDGGVLGHFVPDSIRDLGEKFLGNDHPLMQFAPPLAHADDGFAHWAEINACVGEPVEFYRKQGSYCLEYEECGNDVPTKFCTLHGKRSIMGGHTGYLNDHWVPVDELIWDFFQSIDN